MAMVQEQPTTVVRRPVGLDVRRAFVFVFEDDEWSRKLGIGGLLALIPLVGPLLVYAYTLRAMRWVALDQTATLPQWRRRDARRLLIEGLKFVAVLLLLICPLALCGLVWIMFGGPFPDVRRDVPLFFQGADVRLFFLAVSVVILVAQGRLAVTGSVWSASRPDQVVLTFLAAPLAWTLAGGATLLLSEARDLLVWYLNPAGWGTALVNVLLTVTTTLYLGLVGAHLAGQACRQARRTWGRQALARYR
jgi:hypothetical protein